MPAILMDFYHDWVELLRAKLEDDGYPVAADEDPQRIEFNFFNVQKRLIAPTPRDVFVLAGFDPSASNKVAVVELLKKVRTGDDLTPYLSRGLKKAAYDDLLLNDWGIHHFHLGERVEGDGFVERTQTLLFARVTVSEFFVCGLFDHGLEHPKPWTRLDLVEVLHANWPDSLARFRAHLRPAQQAPTDADVEVARTKRFQMVIQMQDGTVYLPFGGGLSSSGLGADVVWQSDRHADWVDRQEKLVRKEFPKHLREIAEAFGDRMPEEFHFRLKLDTTHALAIDEQHGLVLRLEPVPGRGYCG